MTTMHARFKREVERNVTQAAATHIAAHARLAGAAVARHGTPVCKSGTVTNRPVGQGQTGESGPWRSRIIDVIGNWMRPSNAKQIIKAVQNAE